MLGNAEVERVPHQAECLLLELDIFGWLEQIDMDSSPGGPGASLAILEAKNLQKEKKNVSQCYCCC